MQAITVQLGWVPLLATDPAGLDALQATCRALGVRTRWDARARVLHLESPVEGQAVALTGEGDLAALAVRAGAALAAAGARVGEGGQLAAAVHLVPGPAPCAQYIAGSQGLARRLALALARAAAAHRLHLPVRRAPQGRAPCPTVRIYLPPGAALERWAAAVADGVMRFLAPPELVRLLDRLAGRRRAGAALAAPAALAAVLLLAGGLDCPPPARQAQGPGRRGPGDGPAPAGQGAGQSGPRQGAPEQGAGVPPPCATPGGEGAGGEPEEFRRGSPPPAPDPFRPPGAGPTFTFRVVAAGSSPFAVLAGPAAQTPPAHATVVRLPPMAGGEARRTRRPPPPHWVRSW